MQWSPPEREPWVAHVNALAGNQPDGGVSVLPLDADALLADARRVTGLDDYGDEWFIEPFRVLVKALNEEAALTPVGRLVARSEIARSLQARLQVEDTIRRNPEILEQAVAPVHVVTGLGRTGTSILHELLALDEDNRVPMQWEMIYPVPAPETATFTSDPRIAAADLEVRAVESIVPAIRTMHANGGDLPNECIFLFALSFASELFSGRFNIPSYDMWMATNDLSPSYAYHKRFLQLLQWKHRMPRWVLKAPTHITRLHYLFNTYPDARVVITHRDPLRVLASVTNLLSSLKWAHSDVCNYAGDLQRVAFGNAYVCQMMVDQREAGDLPAGRVTDVRYADLMQDPVAAVEALYRDWDIPFSAALRQRIDEYLAAKPKGAHGAHSYSFADTGLDLGEERARYTAYQGYFGVPSEV